MSVARWLGWPEAFQTAVLILAAALALTPYLAGLTVGTLQVPKLPPRRRQRLRIGGPIVLLLAVALMTPVAALAPSTARLRLAAVDVTGSGLIDVAVTNDGTAAGLLTRIDLEVVRDHRRRVRPVLAPAATYRVPLEALGVGSHGAIVVRHLIRPGETERFLIAPETGRELDVRLRIDTADGTVLAKEVRLWPSGRVP